MLGLVMTVLSKLETKTIDRPSLYYNKYEYRASIKSPNMYYSNICRTIDEYRSLIIDINTGVKKYYGWRPKPTVQDWEYELIDKLLTLISKYKKTLTVRRENETCNIYTSDIGVIKEILDFWPNTKITQVSLMPTGVMLFKKDPPAKYRAYMSNKPMSPDFKEEFLAFVDRTPDIVPSSSFYTWLKRPSKFHYQHHLWDKYYIDYNDDTNLMMMTLMFPGMISKKYKLEKK
jgi:hypothetical protein